MSVFNLRIYLLCIHQIIKILSSHKLILYIYIYITKMELIFSKRFNIHVMLEVIIRISESGFKHINHLYWRFCLITLVTHTHVNNHTIYAIHKLIAVLTHSTLITYYFTFLLPRHNNVKINLNVMSMTNGYSFVSRP